MFKARSGRSLGSMMTTNCSFRFGSAKTETGRVDWIMSWGGKTLAEEFINPALSQWAIPNAKVITFMAGVFLRLGLDHILGIECLSVIIVVIIRRGMGCHQAAREQPPLSTHIYWGHGSTYLHPRNPSSQLPYPCHSSLCISERLLGTAQSAICPCPHNNKQARQ